MAGKYKLRKPKPLRVPYIVGAVCVVPMPRSWCVVVDADDIELVRGINWFRGGNDGYYYAYGVRYGVKVAMHRLICQPADGFSVDHINGNTLDNRRCNLRAVTHAQNMLNRKVCKSSVTGVKGVSWCVRDRKWRAAIQINGKKVHLGQFLSFDDAVRAREEGSLKYHGEFGGSR